jgi:predicted enzyme related to lactoylglutathione lyase
MPRPIHFEVHAADPKRAIDFYSALFGWSFQQWGDQPYWLIGTGEGPGIDGGLMPREGRSPDPAAPDPVISWVCTVDVADVDASVAKAQSLGGIVAVPKMAVPTIGWIAYCKDTEGNIFGMLQSDRSAA